MRLSRTSIIHAQAVQSYNASLPIGKAKCGCCGELALARCDWLIDAPVCIPAKRVKVGDIFISPQTGRHVPVIAVEPPAPHYVGIRVQFPRAKKDPPDAKQYIYHRSAETLVSIMGIASCEQPVCELHMRDVDGRIYCQSHWHSWQELFDNPGAAEAIVRARERLFR